MGTKFKPRRERTKKRREKRREKGRGRGTTGERGREEKCNSRGEAVGESPFPQVSALPIANTDCRTTECSTSDSLGNVFGFRKLLYSCTERMCHSSTCPPNIQVCHCT